MKRTFLAVTMATQLAAIGAVAQTTTGTTGAGMATDTYGSNWSTTLGMAMFGADGSEIRPDGEIATQWATLSEEDKSTIRRDCMVFLQQAGGMVVGTGADADSSGTGIGSAGTADITTDGTGSTSGVDGAMTGGSAADSADGAMGTTEPMTDSAAGTATSAAGSDGMSVSADQMQQICTATRDL